MTDGSGQKRLDPRRDRVLAAEHRAIQTLLILNGGAVIAVLGFTSSLINGPAFSEGELRGSMSILFSSIVIFALGACVSAVSAILSYTAKERHLRNREVASRVYDFVFHLSMFASAGFFLYGLYKITLLKGVFDAIGVSTS